MSNPITNCSFCGKNKDQVEKLIVSHTVAICNECVTLCESLLRGKKDTIKKKAVSAIPDPREICEYLDKYVIGQTQAKRVLSVAVANHFKRINSPEVGIQKANVLMIGSTGTGKTLLAKTVAEYLNVPFVIADATTLTEAGYVGDDVETLISRLYAASDNNLEACQKGIVFLDEIDKIARKGESATVSRDVSGEGVQQALLKLVEGTKCKISVTGGRKSVQGDTVEIDTTNILFVAGGAFVGLDNILRSRLQGTNMGFGAQISSPQAVGTDQVTPDDLVKYGMIPEFIGRFSSIVGLHDLTKEQLINILTEVHSSYVTQYKSIFEQDGVELEFDPESLNLIAERTLEARTGARGLHSELERVLMCHMFELPRYKKNNILKVAINRDQVNTPMTLIQENS